MGAHKLKTDTQTYADHEANVSCLLATRKCLKFCRASEEIKIMAAHQLKTLVLLMKNHENDEVERGFINLS